MTKLNTAALNSALVRGKTVARLFVRNILDHNAARNAASLAYYFIFAIFPLSIFLTNLLGLMALDIASITHAMEGLLPNDAIALLEGYLGYVASTSSKSLLYFSLVFSIWFPMKAVKSLMDDVRRAYALGKPESLLLYTLRQLCYTLLLLVVMGLALPLTILGRQVLGFLCSLLPPEVMPISDYVLGLWHYLRFVPVAVLMLLALGALYEAAMDRPVPVKSLIPGIAASLAVWLGVSILFSYYVENFANYSLIYGTLGAVIMLLVWLYMTGLILIMGAELNAAVLTVRTAERQHTAL